MDSGDSKKYGPTTRRRSARQASTQALPSEDLKPRQTIKRTRKMREDNEASRAVSGSNQPESLTKEDEDETPVKKPKPEEETIGINEKGDGLNQTDHVDVEMGESEDQDQEMSSDEEAEQKSSLTGSSAQPGTEETHAAHAREENLERERSLNRQRPMDLNTEGTEIPKPKAENYRPVTKYEDANSMGAVALEHREEYRLPNMNYTTLVDKRSNMNYQIPVTEKHKNPLGLKKRNTHQPIEPQKSSAYVTLFPITNQTNHKYTASPASSSRGWTWYMCKRLQWSLILTGLLALAYFACQKVLLSDSPQTDVVHPKTVGKFDPELTALQGLFPSQRKVFWERSGKHLKSHLKTVNPTEPVSVILTAGLQAERTLGCIARSLAGVYSATKNASILEIYGTNKKGQDSDQVKLEIDEALREAFEGDKPAAVVHRFEELPPGSTLIFYRYCDHENAAYKKVFLVFTVMLPVDEITGNLREVEGMVFDHIKQKFVISDKSTMFNQMDVDKLSGLWSRISHLILPVAAEQKFEQQGCGA